MDSAAISPKLQVSTPLEIEQPASEVAVSIVQDRPDVVGSVSVTVTPVAVPAPVLATEMTNPMVSPAFALV